MKRFVILLLVGAAFLILSAGVFAEESILIDFSTLAADYAVSGSNVPNENEATIIDFGDKAGTGFAEDEKALMKTSLALNNWEVLLASSSRTVINQSNSITKEVPVKADAKKYPGEKVLGVRVHFPLEPYNSWALVRPPFEIPMYMRKTIVAADGTVSEDTADVNRTKFDGYGVLKNVGVVKTVTLNILGLNFPQGVEVILKDQSNKEMSIFMGYLYFDGWRTLTWNNPNYIQEVRNREITRFPLYPKATPSVKLMGIRFSRDKEQEGGDFITYIKDITVTYDKAVLTLDMDVNNEEVWGILGNRESSRRTSEFEKLGELQVLRTLEKKKMHQETPAAGTN
ncbi:MAG: flagellar protein [Spirochaetales bacterium]|nr:MAG: flagellar protein [Spirochaetales bacterium]